VNALSALGRAEFTMTPALPRRAPECACHHVPDCGLAGSGWRAANAQCHNACQANACAKSSNNLSTRPPGTLQKNMKNARPMVLLFFSIAPESPRKLERKVKMGPVGLAPRLPYAAARSAACRERWGAFRNARAQINLFG